jgi:hypothetical protein
LDANGFWDGALPWVATNSDTSYIQFDLGGAANFVGGFMNYAPGFGSPIISAIGADGTTVLESYDLSIDAPISTGVSAVNDGAFRGIERASNDIYFFRLAGGYLLTSNLEVGVGAQTPEPASFGLAGAGLLFLGFKLRRRH